MIMINGDWEQVKDLSDILRIVSKNIGDEFAQKIQEICGEPSEELYVELTKAEEKIETLEERMKECDEVTEALDYLNSQIDKLKEYIEGNGDNIDYMEGMRKAYEMISV